MDAHTKGSRKRKGTDTEDVRSCDQCEYSGSRQALRHHKKSKHEGIRYPCDLCDYAATTLTNLKKHKKSKHEGIRYPCDQCDFAIDCPKNLTERVKLIYGKGHKFVGQ